MIVKQITLTVTENTRLADGIYRLRLAGDTSAITAPGQFVNLKLSGFFLRRPISVCDWSDGCLLYTSRAGPSARLSRRRRGIPP